MNIPEESTVPIRDLAYHVRRRGEPDAPKVFMLHGWMDVAASFPFLVDALTSSWNVIAPDWRGFGRSEWCRDGYWFPDYLADLEALINYFAPGEPVRLVGYSLGGITISPRRSRLSSSLSSRTIRSLPRDTTTNP